VAGPDSYYTAAVTAAGLRNDGAPPAAGEPSASVTMRRFERTTGAGLFVTVLRPWSDPARAGSRLTRWATHGDPPIRTLGVPVGTARVVASAGTEVTTYQIVVSTPDHVVLTIEGAASVRLAELVEVARGITR
jgi:hypothetical protein